VIFRLFKGELTIKYLMVARETLEIEVRRFRDLIAEQRSSNAHTPCSEFDELSRKLYCDLIEPSLPRLSAVDRICVVPHGILHYLPFACLRGSTWFAEMAPIFRAPSATILGALLDRPERHTIRKVAVLANATPRTEPLEGAESEAKSIKRLFPPATLALGSEATREALRAACTGSDVVHVACHAAFDADAPFLSHIKLAPNEDSGDDGHVNVGMVREVPVSADLVVLSGCETGLNAISAAEEFTGLVHAFIGSGAASVVASLWPVSDAGSCALMETFYAQLRSGIGAVQSLHQARLEVMEERPLPFYWAAFEIHGDWRTFRPVRAS
jgi:CHAT domain-containing protein